MPDLLIPTPRRRRAAIFLTACMLLTPALPGFAATQRVAVEKPAETAVAQREATTASDEDASRTRERLQELLRRVPPSVGTVMRADPSLLANDSYLAQYPALAAFFKEHPEIRSAPSFYLGTYREDFYESNQGLTPAGRLWQDTMQFFAIASAFSAVAFFLIWVLRTIVEYRRWHRMSKVHTEVNNKLLDRFSNNEDLLAYIQTPAGRKFIESAPLPIDGPRPVGAPLGRILWSVQIGVVLAAAAVGLLFISGRVVAEVSEPIFAIGVIAIAVGAGFIVSAGASYVLSRQLGLLDQSATGAGHAATHD